MHGWGQGYIATDSHGVKLPLEEQFAMLDDKVGRKVLDCCEHLCVDRGPLRGLLFVSYSGTIYTHLMAAAKDYFFYRLFQVVFFPHTNTV